ncbi:MAG: 2-hydroxychromene-2-carboxylate isomerase [Pseudomonadota bacterium]
MTDDAPKTFELLFDFVSPTAYLAWFRAKGVVARTGARMRPVPVFLGGIMQATGNRPPGTVAAKGRWMRADLEMWARTFDIPLGRNEHFPVNTLAILRGAVGLLSDPRFDAYCDACFRGVWLDGRDMARPEEIAAATSQVIAPDELMALAQNPANKTALKANTDDAVARGVFGAPSLFVGETLFFGQDRLDWVEKALTA